MLSALILIVGCSKPLAGQAINFGGTDYSTEGCPQGEWWYELSDGTLVGEGRGGIVGCTTEYADLDGNGNPIPWCATATVEKEGKQVYVSGSGTWKNCEVAQSAQASEEEVDVEETAGSRRGGRGQSEGEMIEEGTGFGGSQCTDSDGGKNFLEKGKVDVNGEVKEDYCHTFNDGSVYLFESICGSEAFGNDPQYYIQKKCEEAFTGVSANTMQCVDGKCVKKSTDGALVFEKCTSAKDCSPEVINAVCIDNINKGYAFCMADTDGDGVLDNNPDQCPDTQKGKSVDQYGCIEFDSAQPGKPWCPMMIMSSTCINDINKTVTLNSCNGWISTSSYTCKDLCKTKTCGDKVITANTDDESHQVGESCDGDSLVLKSGKKYNCALGGLFQAQNCVPYTGEYTAYGSVTCGEKCISNKIISACDIIDETESVFYTYTCNSNGIGWEEKKGTSCPPGQKCNIKTQICE